MQNIFSSWRPWRPSWIFDQNDFNYFLSKSRPILPTKFRVNSPFGSEKKRKIDFQNGSSCYHLVFPIGMILATFDIQVVSILRTKFRVNWSFSSGEEVQIDFQDGPSWISDRNDFSFFYVQVALILPTKFRVNWPFGPGAET